MAGKFETVGSTIKTSTTQFQDSSGSVELLFNMVLCINTEGCNHHKVISKT